MGKICGAHNFSTASMGSVLVDSGGVMKPSFCKELYSCWNCSSILLGIMGMHFK